MKKNLLLPLVATIIIGLSANGVMACPDCGPKHKGGPGCPVEKMKEMTPEQQARMKEFHEKKKAEFQARLNLTEAQKAQIEKNREADKAKVEPIFKQLKAKKEEIKTVLYSDLNDVEKDKKLTALKTEKKALVKKLEQIREDNMKAFEAILTPAQRVELMKMKFEKKDKMRAKGCGCDKDTPKCKCKKPGCDCAPAKKK